MYNTNITDRLNKGIDRAKELNLKIKHIRMNKEQLCKLIEEENGKRKNWVVCMYDYKGLDIEIYDNSKILDLDKPIRLIFNTYDKKVKNKICIQVDEYIEC